MPDLLMVHKKGNGIDTNVGDFFKVTKHERLRNHLINFFFGL